MGRAGERQLRPGYIKFSRAPAETLQAVAFDLSIFERGGGGERNREKHYSENIFFKICDLGKVVYYWRGLGRSPQQLKNLGFY